VGSLTALARSATTLDDEDLDWLHALVADWQLLADLSFADLVLWARTSDDDGFVGLAHLRPTTGPTCLPEDQVGRVIRRGQRAQIDVAWADGRIVTEGDPLWWKDVPVREETIPVVRNGRTIAVVARDTNLAAARSPSRLELTYLQSATDLAQMVSEGRFPFPGTPVDNDAAPRVGDGLIRLDREGRVEYASPNALSAYRRLGLTADLDGLHLGLITADLVPADDPVDDSVIAVLSGRSPREGEVEAGGAVVQMRAIPLRPGGERVGALVLLRDITELRRRDRQLMSKDATIREIHHRVKNNLQTVAALLRIQARRLGEPHARHALEEAVRRVGSIAVVHETLSLSLDERVAVDDICDRVLSMTGEVAAAEGGVQVRREGSFGVLPARVATPLAMALTELVQNAVEHGTGPAGGGTVEVVVRASKENLVVVVRDNGVGLPPGFSAEASDRLGLGIVRALVVDELQGGFALGPGPGGGTEARLAVPLG
jgi:two-component sensor histidine kinase